MGRTGGTIALLFLLFLAGSGPGTAVPGPASTPPGQDAVDDYLAAALKEAAKAGLTAPKEAVVLYRGLLNERLAERDRIKVHLLLAQLLERMKGEGESARETWRDIRDAYPADPVSCQAAYRLGELYSSILPDGLKPSLPAAVEQFEYVAAHAPAGRMVAVLAHVNLAQLRERLREPEKALQEYQTVYDLRDRDLEVPPGAAGLPEADRAKVMQPLIDQLARIRTKVVPRMVGCCRGSTPAETVTALKALRQKHAGDAAVTAAVDAALKPYESPEPTNGDAVSCRPGRTGPGEGGRT